MDPKEGVEATPVGRTLVSALPGCVLQSVLVRLAPRDDEGRAWSQCRVCDGGISVDGLAWFTMGDSGTQLRVSTSGRVRWLPGQHPDLRSRKYCCGRYGKVRVGHLVLKSLTAESLVGVPAHCFPLFLVLYKLFNVFNSVARLRDGSEWTKPSFTSTHRCDFISNIQSLMGKRERSRIVRDERVRNKDGNW